MLHPEPPDLAGAHSGKAATDGSAGAGWIAGLGGGKTASYVTLFVDWEILIVRQHVRQPLSFSISQPLP